jgi:glycosyltransferase involved in cell wall biosynthesis
MRVLLATDSFPPRCGGSGWSTYELARGLRTRGHDVIVVQPRPGEPRRQREREYEGIRVIEAGFPAPPIPYVRNYFKNERLYPSLGGILADVAQRQRADIVHGQHVLTSLPAIAAARRVGVPSVVTVRDYWPVCYWSDLIHTSTSDDLCPQCSAAMMTRCIRPRSGPLWPLAMPMIPYMRANLARKRTGLAAADAIIAVSSTIAADLKARAPEIGHTRLEMIPNPVNIAALRTEAAASDAPLQGPYALYLGKLAPNKGTSHLVEVAERAGLEWPLVIVGDGPDRSLLDEAARRSNCDIRLVGWVDRQQATAWLAHASLLVFTSRGPESLSRVLLEGSALGVPIAAINTGGTPDIVRHGETGLLSTSPAGLADDVRRLVADADLRRRLGAAAARWVSQTFAAEAIVARVERLYLGLLEPARRR